MAKLALLAFLEAVFWGQQGLPSEVPVQTDEMLTTAPAAVLQRAAAQVALRQALQQSMHLAASCLLACHALQAAPARLRLCRMLATAAGAEAADEAAQTRLKVAEALHASVHAELELLHGVHLLLSDREMLSYAGHGAAKVALERSKRCRGLLQWLRAQLATELTAAGDDGSGDEDSHDESDEVRCDVCLPLPDFLPVGGLLNLAMHANGG